LFLYSTSLFDLRFATYKYIAQLLVVFDFVFSKPLPGIGRLDAIYCFIFWVLCDKAFIVTNLFSLYHNGNSENTSSKKLGFLSTLVQEGSDCHGYKIRLVGHSLGGAVATVLGMMVKHVKHSLYIFLTSPAPMVFMIYALSDELSFHKFYMH
jgi:hypothetical protein